MAKFIILAILKIVIMDMKQLVEQFISQIKEAIEIGKRAQLKPAKNEIKNVVITGLGGSGIGGAIVSQLVEEQSQVPIIINNTYDIPSFVNQNTLLIASSFSGNTEETLIALEQAQKKGAEIAVISSGGKIIEIAKENNYNHIILPSGDSPRAMLMYSLTQQFVILENYGIAKKGNLEELQSSIELLTLNLESIKQEAREVASKLVNRTPVIYTEAKYEGVAIRLRQQLNENSKVLCWHHVLPEMNHNELVGWAGGKKEYAVIMFRNEDDYYRTQRRMEITKEVVNKFTDVMIEIHSKGSSRIQRSVYLILMGDWISVYLAELNRVDAKEVDIIVYLKGELAKI